MGLSSDGSRRHHRTPIRDIDRHARQGARVMTAFIIFLLVTPGSSLIAYAGREAPHPAKIQVVTLAQCIGQAFMAGPVIAIYRLGCTADGTIRAARLCAL